jgi:hypothetical protein
MIDFLLVENAVFSIEKISHSVIITDKKPTAQTWW